MKVILHQAKIYDRTSPYHLKKKNIWIDNGKIIKITNDEELPDNKKYTIIQSPNLCVSTGWVDMQATFGEPGFEHKETIESGLNCAAAGGFTHVCIHSNTNPPIHNKTVVEFIIKQSQNNIVSLLPVGTISYQQKGEHLSEMYDMKCSGAIAFSDYKNSIENTHLLMRAMLYAQGIHALLIIHCNDYYLSASGQINESETSAYTGLKGIPYIAETVALQKVIELMEYYPDTKVHIPIITSKKSIEIIKYAKSKNLNITCGTTSMHLYFNDTHLKNFDSNLKLIPPLRTEEDRKSLIKAVLNKTIDVIISDHQPQDTESKNVEFDYAEFGAINLQTTFSAANTAIKSENIEILIDAISYNPRKILQLPIPTIQENQIADITIFDFSQNFIFHQNINYSLAQNSPFFEKELKGKVIGIINKNQIFLNNKKTETI